jgi:hypothetical protein
MTKPRRRVKRPRQSARPQKATKPPEGAETLSNTSSKPGLSPERLETIGKVLPGVIRVVAVLIDAISKLPK